jgi:LPXTG-site transpeptidase (sortase) family protein
MQLSAVDPHTRKKLVHVYRRALQSGMSYDQVHADVLRAQHRLTATEEHERTSEYQARSFLQKSVPWLIKAGAFILPMVFIGTGIFLVGSAVTPIASYYFSDETAQAKQKLIAAIPDSEIMDVTPVAISQAAGLRTRSSEPTILHAPLDYTDLSNWFTFDVAAHLQAEQSEDTYLVDIPKVDVFNAEVAIGGLDLNESLIAYPGTALPGQYGSPVIFGHSVLRQFYYPAETNAKRYASIFSFIMTLEKGDPIHVTHEGVRYTYVVIDKTEVMPEDVHILSQRFDVRQLKLVTCVPEGTYLRRGVITAQLVPSEEVKVEATSSAPETELESGI